MATCISSRSTQYGAEVHCFVAFAFVFCVLLDADTDSASMASTLQVIPCSFRETALLHGLSPKPAKHKFVFNPMFRTFLSPAHSQEDANRPHPKPAITCCSINWLQQCLASLTAEGTARPSFDGPSQAVSCLPYSYAHTLSRTRTHTVHTHSGIITSPCNKAIIYHQTAVLLPPTHNNPKAISDERLIMARRDLTPSTAYTHIG